MLESFIADSILNNDSDGFKLLRGFSPSKFAEYLNSLFDKEEIEAFKKNRNEEMTNRLYKWLEPMATNEVVWSNPSLVIKVIRKIFPLAHSIDLQSSGYREFVNSAKLSFGGLSMLLLMDIDRPLLKHVITNINTSDMVTYYENAGDVIEKHNAKITKKLIILVTKLILKHNKGSSFKGAPKRPILDEIWNSFEFEERPKSLNEVPDIEIQATPKLKKKKRINKDLKGMFARRDRIQREIEEGIVPIEVLKQYCLAKDVKTHKKWRRKDYINNCFEDKMNSTEKENFIRNFEQNLTLFRRTLRILLKSKLVTITKKTLMRLCDTCNTQYDSKWTKQQLVDVCFPMDQSILEIDAQINAAVKGVDGIVLNDTIIERLCTIKGISIENQRKMTNEEKLDACLK